MGHLAGFLAGIGEEKANVMGQEAFLSTLAAEVAAEVRAAADRLEADL